MDQCRRHIRTADILIMAIILILPGYACAKSTVESLAELSFEQLLDIQVSSTSFFDIAPEKSPGSVYIISNETIETSYADSIADFLAFYVPGVHISNGYSLGALYSTRGIASSSNATTLFMLDGESMNTSNGSGINTNLSLPLLGYVDRIEVLKGPCSIIHGSGSINGFVNVVQKNGTDNPGGFVNIETAFPGSTKILETGYGYASEKIGDLYLYAGAVQSDGISQGDTRINAFPDISSRFSVNWRKNNFQLSSFYQSVTTGCNLDLSTPDSRKDSGETVMKSAVVIPEFELSLTDKEVLNLKLPVQHFEYDPDYFSSDSDNLDSEWQINPKILLKTTRFQGHSLALGALVSVCRFHADDVVLGFDPENSTSSEVDINWLETSLLVEDTYQISRNVILFAGLRYDRFHLQDFDLSEKSIDTGIKDDTMTATTPRVGITWNLTSTQTLKLMYQEGHHFPDYINYLRYGNPDQSTGTEKIKSYEAGYSWNFLEDKYRFALDCYYNTQEGSINFSPPSEDTQSSEQRGERIITEKLTSIGFETGLGFIPDDTIQMELFYSFSRPYNIDDSMLLDRFVDDSGSHWKAYPEHTVKFNLSRRMLDGRLNVSLGCLYNGPVNTMNRDSHENENDLFDHHRFVVNAGIRYRFTEHCFLIFRAKNIFNNDVPATGYYYEDMNRNGSTLEAPVYALGLTWNF